jgi:hypothetical protein
MAVITAIATWAAHVFIAIVQVLSWVGLGSLLLRRLRVGVLPVDFVNWVGAGAVGFALGTLAVGLVGMLYAPVIIAATIVAAVIGVVALRPAVGRVALPNLLDLPRQTVALGVLLGSTIGLAAIATGAPVNGYDALLYHVSVPVLYEEQHKVFEVAWSWSAYQPFNVEMLITDGLLLWDPVQGAFAPFALVLGATAAVSVGGWLIGGTRLASLAAAIFFVQPLVAWESTASLVDGGIAFAVALTALNLLVWVTRRQPGALVLAGLFAGAGAGMKYIGVFAAFASGVAVLLAAERGRRFASAVAFAAPAALVALPWYLKNWILTGNPIFPFVFGGASRSAHVAIDNTLGEFGYGHSPADALLLPVRLVIDSHAFDGSGWLTPLVLVFPLLALLDRPRRRGVWIALVACLVYGACWFLTSQQARFLIPMLPVLSMLAAIGLQAVASRGRAGRAVATVTAGAALTVSFGVFAFYCLQFFPVVSGVQAKSDFLAERTGYYDGVAWLNREVAESDRVLIDFPSPYLERPYTVWTPLVIPGEVPPESMPRLVREMGVCYVAVLSVNEEVRRRYLDAAHARRIATVDVHTAFLGLRRWGGFPYRLFVYRLPQAPNCRGDEHAEAGPAASIANR